MEWPIVFDSFCWKTQCFLCKAGLGGGFNPSQTYISQRLVVEKKRSVFWKESRLFSHVATEYK